MLRDLLKTKTFWSGLGMVAHGLYMVLSGNIENGIQMIVMGLSVIFLRDAIRKIGQ